MPKVNKKSRNPSNTIRVKSKFSSVSPVNTAVTANNLGNIGVDPASILANDVNLANLADMFRLFRINEVTFHFAPATGTGSAATVEIPSGFLLANPYGVSTSPTDIAAAETPNVSVPTVPFGTATATAPLTRECGTTLALRNKDLPVLQGPGGGWLATQADGSQTNYGALWWLTAAATAANTLNYLLRTVFDVSFKDLLDPSLISKLFAMHSNGLPDHWELEPGSLLHSVNQSAKQGIKVSPSSELGLFSAARLRGLTTPTPALEASDEPGEPSETDALALAHRILEARRLAAKR